MDILHLVDRLEELYNESRTIWFTHSVAIDDERLLDIIDQMRVSIPEEIKKAQQIVAQRDRFLAQAQEEAARTVQLAREEREGILANNNEVQAAKVRAEEIIAQARLEAEKVKRDADEYVLNELGKLEMERLLNQARNGIRALQAEQEARNQVENQQSAALNQNK